MMEENWSNVTLDGLSGKIGGLVGDFNLKLTM